MNERMPEEWLIDGFNLLYFLRDRQPHKRKKVPLQGEDRTALFGLLADFASSRKCRVWMVLDGKGDDVEFTAFQTPWFQICYSQAVSADAVIEKYLCEKKGRAMFSVVTGDRAVAQMARGSGARVLDAESFFSMLKDIQKENTDILFKRSVESHGFHRPFEGKL